MTESILQIKDLKKSFGDNEILKGISLDVKQGEVVVILGSSGCGKSTLLRCINGLETIQGGDILLDGKSITGSKKDFHLIRQKIGMVFQSYDLFPHLDILQNLILGPVKAQGRNKEEVIAEAENFWIVWDFWTRSIASHDNCQVVKSSVWPLSAPCSCILKLSSLTR